MSQAPAMPLFTDALIGDTTHLSTEEFGAYMLILITTWRNNGIPFPDDDKLMSRRSRMSERRWTDKVRPMIVGFFDLSGGTWRQGRLEKEWNFVANLREENSRKGKLGGRPKSLNTNDTTKATASSQLKPEESPHTHTQEERKPTPIGVVKKLGTRLSDDFVVSEDWIDQANAARVNAGLPTADLRTEGVKFVNYWSAKSGQGATKANWLRTWINWALNAKASNGTPSNGHAPLLDFGQGAEFSQWRARMKGREKLWLDSYGPPPGKPGCKVPPQILREFGMGAGT